MRTTRGVLTLLALLLVSTTSLAAQQQGGFWWEIGGGYGFHGCTDCNGNGGGVSGTIGLGGTLTPNWRLALGSTLWTRDSDAGRVGLLTFELRTRFYPRPEGFYLSGAIGGGSDIRRADDGTENPVNGAVASLGLGYDAHLTGTVSFTPYLTGLYFHTTPHSTRMIHAGIALTFP